MRKKNFKYLIFILPISLIMFGIFGLCTLYKYGTINTYINSKPTDCVAVLPNNYKLVHSKECNRYAIGIITVWGQQYLWSYKGCVNEHFAPYTTFADSCIAKSFALQHIKEKKDYSDKINSYK